MFVDRDDNDKDDDDDDDDDDDWDDLDDDDDDEKTTTKCLYGTRKRSKMLFDQFERKLARKRENKTDCCTLLSVMIAFLPYLGYAKYKNYKV